MAEASPAAKLKSSLSADDIDKSPKKPGRLSVDILEKFESDPALSSSPEHRPFPRPQSTGHGSSSDIEPTSSQENIKSRKNTNVRISIPEKDLSFSSNDEMLSDGEHDHNKHDKKRRSRWHIPSWKRVRRFFSRKKNPKRAKSCEELPTQHYKPMSSSNEAGSEESSLRFRAKSDPMLPGGKKRPTSIAVAQVYSAGASQKTSVTRTGSMPPPVHQKPSGLLQELKKRQSSSHEEVREEDSEAEGLSPVAAISSKATSLPILNMGVGRREVIVVSGGSEGSVSFESTASSSSLEGMQAAHDKIKAAPRHRRPPTRNRSRTSSHDTTVSPLKEDPAHHKKSKTDPRDLSKGSAGIEHHSDIMNNTIFEGNEEEGSVESSPSKRSNSKEVTAKTEPEAMAEIKARASMILSQTTEPAKLPVTQRKASTLPATSHKPETLGSRDSLHESKSTEAVTKHDVETETEKVVLRKLDSVDDSSIEKKSEDNMAKGIALSESLIEENKEGFFEVQNTKRKEIKEEKEIKGSNTESVVSPRKLSCPSSLTDKERTSSVAVAPKPKPPIKRGKSWSANYIPNLQETPIITDQPKNELNRSMLSTSPAKKNTSDVEKENEKGKPELAKKPDSRFVRTKSWSVQTKKRELKEGEVEATDVVMRSSVVKAEDDGGDQPSWIAMANRASKRYSQLLQNDDTSSMEQVTIVSAENEEKSTQPTTPQPAPVSKTDATTPPQKPQPTTPPSTKMQFEIKTRSASLKSPSSSKTENTRARNSVHEIVKTPFNSTKKLDKCAVCGTTVYQMEKCKFDDCVLHRQCIKCAVCKRHLTVGNFVMAESKIYCNSHGQSAVVVS